MYVETLWKRILTSGWTTKAVQTMLMNIVLERYCKGDERVAHPGHVNDYHTFEQALYDEISTSKMEGNQKKQEHHHHQEDDVEHETVQI